MKTRERGRGRISVTGIVTAQDWGSDDEVVAVAICAADEHDYVVRAEPVVKLLLRHLDELVEATGTVVDDPGTGQATFELAQFSPVGIQDVAQEGWGARQDDEQRRRREYRRSIRGRWGDDEVDS